MAVLPASSAGNFDFATAVDSDVELFRKPNLMHISLKRVLEVIYTFPENCWAFNAFWFNKSRVRRIKFRSFGSVKIRTQLGLWTGPKKAQFEMAIAILNSNNRALLRILEMIAFDYFVSHNSQTTEKKFQESRNQNRICICIVHWMTNSR